MPREVYSEQERDLERKFLEEVEKTSLKNRDPNIFVCLTNQYAGIKFKSGTRPQIHRITAHIIPKKRNRSHPELRITNNPYASWINKIVYNALLCALSETPPVVVYRNKARTIN